MILDTDGSSCVTVDFGIGGGTSTRQWDIMVKIFQLHFMQCHTKKEKLQKVYYPIIISHHCRLHNTDAVMKPEVSQSIFSLFLSVRNKSGSFQLSHISFKELNH